MRFPQDYLYVISKRRRLFWGIFLTVIAVTAALILFLPRRYEASATLLLNSGRTVGPAGAVMSEFLGASSATSPETQLEVVTARPNLEGVIRELGLKMRPEDLRKDVHVMHPKQTEILKVFAHGETPRQAADIANSLTDKYVKRLKAIHESETDTTAGDVHRRLDEIEEQLEEKDEQIVAWLREHDLGLPDQEMAAKVQAMNDAEQQLQAAQLYEIDRKHQVTKLRSDLEGIEPTLRASEIYAVSPVVEQLQSKLYDLYIQRRKLLAEYNEDQPEITDVDEQIEETKTALQDSMRGAIEGTLQKKEQTDAYNPARQETIIMLAKAEAELAAAEAQRKELGRILPDLKREVEAIPVAASELDQLKRERGSLAAVWAKLVERYEELKVQEYANAVRPNVVEAATPPTRMERPRPVMYSAVGLFLALILSITACVAMESVDRRVARPRDARELLGVPSLGAYSRALPAAEADRLWGRLTLAGAGADWRVLAVLPASEKNGSRTADALAESARRQGHKVLVVSPDPGEGEAALSDLSASAGSWRAASDVVLLDLRSLDEDPVTCGALRYADRVMLDVEEGADADAVAENCLDAIDASPARVVGAAVFTGRRHGEVRS